MLPEHNADIGGAKGSYHLTGQAFDITSPDISYKQLYEAAVESKLFSTIIRYDKTYFVHVDTRKRKGYQLRTGLGINSYFLNRSECDPVLIRCKILFSSSIRYISSQSGSI